MRIAVTGAAGMLASDLLAVLADEHEVYGLDIRKPGNQIAGIKYQLIDITEARETYETITKINPQIVVHTAAFRDTEEAEKNNARSFQINALGTRNVALACQRFDAALMYISTDYVFDGEKEGGYLEYEQPHPLSVYGQSKYWGELYVQWLLNRFYIIRTSWLFGKNGENFVQKILSQVKNKESLKVVTDQIGSPTYTVDLSLAIRQLINIDQQFSTGLYGIWHITNSDTCPWYDFAREILKQINTDHKIEPITSTQLNRSAKRPKNSVLKNYNWELHDFGRLPSWRDALQRYLRG